MASLRWNTLRLPKKSRIGTLSTYLQKNFHRFEISNSFGSNPSPVWHILNPDRYSKESSIIMCGNIIYQTAIYHVYSYMKLNLRNLLYVITIQGAWLDVYLF